MSTLIGTINAIDLAIEIGMGKRNNTILQSAFFSLAKVLPEEDAIRFMKEKAKASYLKKGQDVVDMNYKACLLYTSYHRRHRPGHRDRYGQAQQHHPPVRVLLSGQGHALSLIHI